MSRLLIQKMQGNSSGLPPGARSNILTIELLLEIMENLNGKKLVGSKAKQCNRALESTSKIIKYPEVQTCINVKFSIQNLNDRVEYSEHE